MAEEDDDFSDVDDYDDEGDEEEEKELKECTCPFYDEKEHLLHNQHVTRLNRLELEHRFLRVYEDNIKLKRDVVELETNYRRLGTRLQRFLWTLQPHGPGLPGARRRRVWSIELLLGEQAQRIAALEQENEKLRDEGEAMSSQFTGRRPFFLCRRVTGEFVTGCRGTLQQQWRQQAEIGRLQKEIRKTEKNISVLRAELSEREKAREKKKGKGKGKKGKGKGASPPAGGGAEEEEEEEEEEQPYEEVE